MKTHRLPKRYATEQEARAAAGIFHQKEYVAIIYSPDTLNESEKPIVLELSAPGVSIRSWETLLFEGKGLRA